MFENESQVDKMIIILFKQSWLSSYDLFGI